MSGQMKIKWSQCVRENGAIFRHHRWSRVMGDNTVTCQFCPATRTATAAEIRQEEERFPKSRLRRSK